jgi:uncharacterized membrane protein
MPIRQIKFKWLRLLFILSLIILCIGIAFRVTNIDRKVYWHDEAYTSLRISGYTMKEFERGAYANRDKSIRYLQKFQRFKPGSQLKDTIHSLALVLYFVKVLGESIWQ